MSIESAQVQAEVIQHGARERALQSTLRWILASPEGMLIVIVGALWVFLSFRSDVFMTERNMGVLLSQVSLIAITGFGMTLLLIAREVDLSVGSMQAFVGVIAMQALNDWGHLLLGVAVAIAAGLVVGGAIATVTLRLGISSFIVTLATMQIIRGAAYTTTNAAVQNHHKIPAFKQVFNGAIIHDPVRVPWPVAIMLVLFIIFSLVLTRTTFGRSIYALGGNPQAANLSGIPVQRLKTACFIITSITASISAFMLIARMNSGQNNAGFGFELQVIGAVLLGGASLAGGKGSLLGTLLATLLLGSLNNGITLLGYNPNWQWAITGMMILLAVLLDTARRRITQED